VIVILVVNGQLMDVGAIELTRAAPADPREDFERPLAIRLGARVAVASCLGDDTIETRSIRGSTLIRHSLSFA
jgi:hypothetical protein